MQTMLESRTTAARRQHDACLLDAHLPGVHDFVSRSILEHTVLMYTRRVGKGILTNDSLVRLHRHIHQRRHHTARRINLLSVDIRINTQIRVSLENHRHLLERRIASTLTNAIDGHLDLTSPVEHTSHGIGRRHAQIIMAMRREYTLACRKSIDMLVEILYLLAILIRRTEARSVRDITYRSTSLTHSLDDPRQILIVRTSSILGVKLHVLDITLGILHRSHSPLDNLLRRRIKLIPDMALARPDTRMNTPTLSKLQSLSSRINILLHRASQCANRRPRHSLAYLHHAIEVARRAHRETSLNHVHAQSLKLACHLNLLDRIELTPRHLLAIAQRSIKNEQSFAHVSIILYLIQLSRTKL